MTEGLVPEPRPAPNQRNAAIDLLRGGSILYIVGFWHLLGYVDGIDGYKNALTERLTVVVLGLFTLMAGTLAGRQPIRSGAEVWRYYRSRALRILPPYGLALGLFGLTGLLRWREVTLGFLLLPEFDGHPLRTLWYVNMLVLFYGAAPLLLLLRHRRQGLAGVAAAVAGFLLVVLAGGGLDPRLGLYFPAFATGLLLSGRLLGCDGAPGAWRRRWGPMATAAAMGLCAMALVISLGVPGPAVETSLRLLPLATAAPAVVVLASTRRLRGHSLPGWLVASSTASYFIYLLHRPLFKGLKAVAAALHVGHPWGLLLWLLACGLPLIVGIAWWSQRLYNRSLRALGL